MVRFITTKGLTINLDLDGCTPIGQVKEDIWSQWPENFPERPSSSSALKLVYSGAFLKNDQTIGDLRCVTDEMTIHLIIPKPKPAKDAEPSQSEKIAVTGANLNGDSADGPNFVQRNEQGELEMNQEAYFHFHGCTVSEEEVEQMLQVFEKKSNPETGLMPFDRIHSFLRTYWRFSKSREFIEAERQFPTRKMLELRDRVLQRRSPAPSSNESSADNSASGADLRTIAMTQDQFLELFFLFDNSAPTTQCPHGARARVRRATEQLHAQIQTQTALHARSEELAAASASSEDGDEDETSSPATESDEEGQGANSGARVAAAIPFDEELFDQLFETIDRDNDDMLTCQEVDLIYYMYSAKIMIKHPAPQLPEDEKAKEAQQANGENQEQQKVCA